MYHVDARRPCLAQRSEPFVCIFVDYVANKSVIQSSAPSPSNTSQVKVHSLLPTTTTSHRLADLNLNTCQNGTRTLARRRISALISNPRGPRRVRLTSSTCPSTTISMPSPGSSRIRLSDLTTYQTATSSRLKFLYSDFTRHKHSNPSSYASNIDWWRRTLEAAVYKGWQSHSSDTADGDRLILHVGGPALADVFRLEGVGKPIGLPGVIVSPFLCPSPTVHVEAD